MIETGKLIHTLVFQTKTETSDGMGAGGAESWADTVTVRAERWNVAGAQRVEGARARQNSTYRWHCRFNASIVPSMRIKWVDRTTGTTHYQEVLAVNLLGNDGRELEVLAEEKA